MYMGRHKVKKIEENIDYFVSELEIANLTLEEEIEKVVIDEALEVKKEEKISTDLDHLRSELN